MALRTNTFGKVTGGAGLVLLLSSPFTWFILPTSPWLAGGKAVLGIVFIAFYLATNDTPLRQYASKRSTFFMASAWAMALILLGALGALNYIAAKKNRSWDLTNKKIHTLAPQTKATLQGLREKVTAIAFLGNTHPVYERLDQLLRRYRDEAPTQFDFIFRDPLKHPDLALKYGLKEGQATVVLVQGNAGHETQTSLTLVSEQDLTNALLKLNSSAELKAYFVTGHGEWPLELTADAAGAETSAISELSKALTDEGYTPVPLQLLEQPNIPKDAGVVVIAGAKSRLLEPEVKALSSYLEQGGRLMVFADAHVEAGLDDLLKDHGIQVDTGVVADDRYMVDSPYMIVAPFYGNHEIARVLKAQQKMNQFPTTRGLTVLRQGMKDGVKAEPVVLTSPNAWEETVMNDAPSPTSGEKTGQIPLVVASTRNTSQAKGKRFDEARVVVFGDSELIADVNWGHEANRNLVLNAFAWASNQAQKMTIRPPDRDVSTVDLSPQTLSRIRFVSVDLLPFTFLSLGIAIWLVRRHA